MLKMKAFSSHHRGYSHVKTNSECEDYSLSYNDPSNRFYISVISDGHSDKNCFRSSIGSRFACEAAKEILTRFCESYLESELSFNDFDEERKERLKRSIKQCWDNKVEQDIRDHPFTEEELEPLSDKVRSYYTSGQAIENAYGATFIAAVVCKDLFAVFHIGDGEILSITSDGKYIEPVIYDPQSDTGMPASICDNDLFKRDLAFRCEIYGDIPKAVFMTSDGIGDSLDALNLRKFLFTLLTKLEEKRDESSSIELNEIQQTFLDSCASYYADANHGVEDDCSIGGIYVENSEIPKVSVPLEYAIKLYDETVREYNLTVSDYERRKKETVQEVKRLEKFADNNRNEWLASKEKCEELKQILKNISNNEMIKVGSLENRLALCREYVEEAGGTVEPVESGLIIPIDPSILEEDKEYYKVKGLISETEEAKEQVETENKEPENNDSDSSIEPSTEQKDETDIETPQAATYNDAEAAFPKRGKESKKDVNRKGKSDSFLKNLFKPW